MQGLSGAKLPAVHQRVDTDTVKEHPSCEDTHVGDFSCLVSRRESCTRNPRRKSSDNDGSDFMMASSEATGEP